MGLARNLANFKPSSAGLAGVEDLDSSAQSLGIFRNRIINGAMVIDQRNAGASVDLSGSARFPVDRFVAFGRLSGGATGQRSTVAPAGFTNSLLYTSTSSGSVPSDTYPCIVHSVEGFNMADLGWGTANAQPVTISFWVRSSVTGTYALSIRNSSSSHSYVAQYTIVSANTWEQKTITVAGVTAGTWVTDNGKFAEFMWDMGFGFGNTTTPNTWSTDNLYRVSSNVRLAETSGATFYITGVQVEKGSVATPYEYRNYQQELAMCQRYFERSDGNQQVVGGAPTGFGNNTYGSFTHFLVQKRATPTVVAVDMVGNTGRMSWWQGTVQYNNQTFGPETLNTRGFSADTTAGRTDAGLGRFTWTASAEL
jgi:hypothetical protein